MDFRSESEPKQCAIMMMMMIIIIIIIIIAFKGAIPDFFFYNLLIASRTVSNTYAQVTLAQSCANHVPHAYHMQHVLLRATWYEGTAQLLSLTELKSHLFELYFMGWTIKPMKRHSG